MELAEHDRQMLIEELISEFDGRLDGGRKNVLISQCPFCGHSGYKFGIYVGPEAKYKTFGSSNCFYCNKRFSNLKETLTALDRKDLIPKEVVELNGEDDELILPVDQEDEVDDSLIEITMPKGYKRAYKNRYLDRRDFEPDDYQYFPCGTTRGCNRRFDDYVLLEIRDKDRLVGFVGRHTWDKEDIEEYNYTHKYKIMRYRNSIDNGFSKILYNIDAVIEYKTRCVILCEGAFDVIALTRKLELYDIPDIVPVCTFGKKISDTQIYKLQEKGVETVVIGYDVDAKDTIIKVAQTLDSYFDTFIADIPQNVGKDWDEMDEQQIYDVFCNNIKTIREFGLNV